MRPDFRVAWKRQGGSVIRSRCPLRLYNGLRQRMQPWEYTILAMSRSIRKTWMGLLVFLAFTTSHRTTTMTSAQDISISTDGVCACSPPRYTFILDLSLTCPPTNITTGSGVTSVTCLVSPFGAPTTDLAPVVINSIGIIELDQTNSVLVEERRDNELFDGATFSYSSIINNPEEVDGVQKIPKALQLNLSGRNEDGVMLMSILIIVFSNECGVLPVIHDGQSAGWVIFSETSDPIPAFCPTLAPSSAPANSSTNDPTRQLTKLPTQTPIYDDSSPQPTDLRIDDPTPQRNQSQLPTDEPTSKETAKPTPQIIDIETIEPTTKACEELTKYPSTPPSVSPKPAPVSLDKPSTNNDSNDFSESPRPTTTGPPTMSAVPSSSRVQSALFDTTMSMSMSMSLWITEDIEYSQFWTQELEGMEELFNN